MTVVFNNLHLDNFEEETKESDWESNQADCDTRDYGKEVHSLEIEFNKTCDKLQKASKSLERKRCTKKRRAMSLPSSGGSC